MKTIFALAILSSIAATPAMAESFTRDGVTYDYNVKTVGESTLISGTIVNSGQSFRLRLRDGRVSGQVGVWPVSFKADSAAVAVAGGTPVFAAN
jgi:hypothetical protein